MEANPPQAGHSDEEAEAASSPPPEPKLPRPNALLFSKATLRGTTYDLGHLDPFSFKMTCGQKTFTVGVIFSCHCFTEELQGHHTPDLHYTHSDETRAFCVNRYALSRDLPGMITTLGNRSVYWNKNGNFFFWRTHPLASPYLVFFNAKKAKENGIQVLLNVDSAHLKPNMTQYAAPIKFTTLVEARATGQQIKPGPFQQIKRK